MGEYLSNTVEYYNSVCSNISAQQKLTNQRGGFTFNHF